MLIKTAAGMILGRVPSTSALSGRRYSVVSTVFWCNKMNARSEVEIPDYLEVRYHTRRRVRYKKSLTKSSLFALQSATLKKIPYLFNALKFRFLKHAGIVSLAMDVRFRAQVTRCCVIWDESLPTDYCNFLAVYTIIRM